MEVIRWIIGIILISASFWVLIVNWMALVLSIISQRFHSQVPLCGALLGIGGLLLMPIKMPCLFFYFLPAVLDCGTIMCVAWGVYVVYKGIKTKARLIVNKDHSRKA